MTSCRGSEVRLEVPPGTTFNVDGEVVASDSATFTVDAAAVEVVVG